jgi:preprotein translocase subunit SecF
MSVFHEAPNAPRVDMEMEGLFRKGGNMRITVVAAALLMLIFTGSGLAMESKKPSNSSATTIEQKKAQRLRDLDQRIKKLQQEKTCVKAAKSSDDLDSCTKKQSVSSGKKAASKQTGKSGSSAKPGKAKSSTQGVQSEPDDEAAE